MTKLKSTGVFQNIQLPANSDKRMVRLYHPFHKTLSLVPQEQINQSRNRTNMVGTRSDVSKSQDASGKCKKGCRNLEEMPEKPPAIERRQKSRLAGGGTNSKDSSPSVLENLIEVANGRRTTGETNRDNRTNNNADDKDVSPRGRMGRESKRENRMDDDVSNNDVLRRETTNPETNNRRDNRMNDSAKELPRGMVLRHETSDTDKLQRGTMGPETSKPRHDNRGRDNRMNDSASELLKGMVRRETNYHCANRMSDLGDKEEVLRRGMVRVMKPTGGTTG
jgi:hypothetical protein